jgi:predicted dienelactone hydrolase
MRTIAVLGLLLAARVASAGDACLAGAAELTDERGLAALRADTEAACPCAEATSRQKWQACARGTLRAALAAGTLRADCRKTAAAANRGRTCGSDKVACGRLRPRSRTPVSCKVTAPSRCTDRHAIDATACAAETACADVVRWTAGTCIDPRQPGPYAPGVRVVHLEKPSVIDPANTRVLDTLVWYPAPPGSGPIDPSNGGVPDAPLDLSGGPYPLLLFSHGSCGYPAQSTFLTPLLASYGFVVAAPPHPGNTIFNYPACGTPSAQGASFVERPADIVFVTDQLLAANGDPASFLYGAVDPARLGMSGHSFGGLTTFLVLARDPRFGVAMPLAPATNAAQPLTVPALMMLGNVDTVVDNDAARGLFAAGAAPKLLVEVRDAGHFAFSDGCFPGPDCNPPVTRTQDEAHEAVLRWVVPFLEVYLAGDETFRPFLAPPTPPDVLVGGMS